MKKIVYIGMLFLALVATSCSKEEVVTVVNDDNSIPEWDNSYEVKKSDPNGAGSDDSGDVSGEEASSDEEPSGEASSDDGVTPVIDPTPIPADSDPIREITDPNNDPDGKKKKK